MQRPLPDRRRSFVLACVGAACGVLARAQGVPPQGVVLTVSGKVRPSAPANRVDFEMSQLAALPQHSFTTSTPWDKVPRKFTGPRLRDVLAAAGAHGQSLLAVGLDDYKVTIPVSDAQGIDVIVARLVDDKPMRVRDRGPLLIIYPYDADPKLHNDMYFFRSAWQLRRLEVQ
jgi:hypothetical protein